MAQDALRVRRVGRLQEMPEKRANYLENVLYTCVDEGLEHMYVIAQTREDVRMSNKEIVDYYQGIRYWAGVGEQKAIRLFRRSWTTWTSNGLGRSGHC